MEPAPRTARTAPRVLGVAAAVAVLAAALMATQSFTNSNHEPDDTAQIATTPEHIRGAKVFQPDVIRASLSTGGDSTPASGGDPAAQQAEAADQREAAADAGPAGQAAQPAPQRQAGAGAAGGGVAAPTTTAAAQQPGPGAPQPPKATTTKPNPTTTTAAQSGGLLDPILDPLDPITGPILGPILGFYAAAPDRPTDAYGLLDPALQESTAEEFARSWAGVSDAEVESATPDGDNTFVVEVLLERTDGIKMLAKQRIVVGDGPDAKIVDAELLSVALR